MIKVHTLALLLAFIVSACNLFVKEGEKQKGPSAIVHLVPQVYISYLPGELQESSGLLLFRGNFLSMNDSGGLPVLYVFHRRTGEVLQRISLSNAANRDWEALAQDDNYIYVGDFGNNSGTRNDLRIFRIRKADISETGDTHVLADTIAFSYLEQDDFSFRNYAHSFDCEAMISLEDKLILFTKDWVDQQTKMYVLPVSPGNYRLAAQDSFPVNGLVTDAGYLAKDSLLVLSGYRDFTPFVLAFHGFDLSSGLQVPSTRYEMSYIFRVQTEGITILNADSVFLSSERTDLPPQLYLLKLAR